MASSGRYIMGQVMKRGIGRDNTLKVRCLQMKLDTYLNKYFNERKHIWAKEYEVKCNVGDIVLLQEMSELKIPRITHDIKEVVFPLGMVVDPITGRRCRGTEYIDESNRKLEAEKIATEKSL
ncbi:hypothetical protein SNE40_013262 [Patella caerulea]|uniref:Mitochondrial ribosomal protein S17 n=1 Tax=Patella caerulea TaxID=87958 RepID=A0AAN8JLU2_PATCE